jgi:hypothetical protein
VLAIAAILAGCTSSVPAGQDELDEAIARWHQAGLASYSYRSDMRCFCSADAIRPMNVTVQQGQVTSVVDRLTGVERPLAYGRSIDSVLARVRVELRDPTATVEVTYDPVLGYPRRFSVTRKNVEDADVTITLDSVVAIP